MFPSPAQLGVRFAPGTMLGRYELLATIGVGGMASVILARQRGPGGFEKAVVIKLIHPHMAQDTVAVNMLLDEAKVAAQLDHQNIVHTYELGEAHGTYYIVMEYLAGESLGQVLKQGQKQDRPLSPFSAAKIVADAAEGLHYAHDLADFNGNPIGIVHRDVSPGNIVVQYNGSVKVVDFGIAKAQGRVTSTQDGELKGKYGYMSPEQIKNEPMDRRSDVFSLGVVLWESLARRRLFQADNVAATLMQILQGDRTPPSAYDVDIPHALDAVTLRALAPDPRDRYQSVAEMKKDIDDAIWRSRIGTSEIALHMQTLFADRIETRKTLLARATHEMLSVGDLEVLSTAFRDPSSQPVRPVSVVTPDSGVLLVPAPRAPELTAPSDLSADTIPRPVAPAPVWTTPGGAGRPLNLPPIAAAPDLPRPIVQRSSLPGWTPPSENNRASAPRVRPSAASIPERPMKTRAVAIILIAGAVTGIVLGLFVGLSGGSDDDKKPDPVAVTKPEEPAPEPVAVAQPEPPVKAPTVSEAMTQPTVTPIPPVPAAPTVTKVNPPEVLPPPVVEPPVPKQTPQVAVQRPERPVKPPPDDPPPVKKPSGNEAELYKKGTDAFIAGELGTAERAFKQALALNRGYAPAYRGLGFVYQRSGASTKALQALRTYLKLTPNAADGAAIRKRIQQLGGE
ncbi:MAG: protein kinase [Deltaproteobacteria bacterium]|nr:protein kinase [Deltaproteobacteria bacterium]